MSRRRVGEAEGGAGGQPGAAFITTARAGALLGVSPPTVVSWISRGMLRAHLTPGGHRRIDPADLTRFAAQRGVQIKAGAVSDDDDAPDAILIWDTERDYAETVAEFIAIGLGMRPVVVDDLVGLSFQLGRARPRAVLVEWGLLDQPALGRLMELGGAALSWTTCLPIADPALRQRAITHGFHRSVHRGQPMPALVEVLRG